MTTTNEKYQNLANSIHSIVNENYTSKVRESNDIRVCGPVIGMSAFPSPSGTLSPFRDYYIAPEFSVEELDEMCSSYESLRKYAEKVTDLFVATLEGEIIKSASHSGCAVMGVVVGGYHTPWFRWDADGQKCRIVLTVSFAIETASLPLASS